MLTQEQLQRLEPLTKDLIFGKLLHDAIKTWKNKNINPFFGRLGIKLNLKTFELEASFANETNSCCLVGAAILKKENPTPYNLYVDEFLLENFYKIIANIYDLEADDVENLVCGFDCKDINKEEILKKPGKHGLKAYEFGMQVHWAIWEGYPYKC